MEVYRNTAGITINFIIEAAMVGFIFLSAFFPSKPAPIAIKVSGEAIAPMLVNGLLIK